MNLKLKIRKIASIALMEGIIIVFMFTLLILLKLCGIEGGMITRTIPFLSILVCTLFTYYVIDKAHPLWKFRWHAFVGVIIFLLIAMMPAMLDGNFLPDVIAGRISYGILPYYLLVALAEELFFRAYIRYKLQELNSRYWIVLSAFAFAAIHFISSEQLTLPLFFLLFLFGVAFAITYENLRSLPPLIAFHTMWNFLTDLSENYSNVLLVLGVLICMILVSLFVRKLSHLQRKVPFL